MSQTLTSKQPAKLRCAFCGKNNHEHSTELWQIHQDAIPANAKLATMQLGFGPRTLAKIVKWNTVNGDESPYHVEYIPIYISCKECGSSMSSSEAEMADVLSQHCLKCFCEMTDQEYSWHSKPWWEVNGGKYMGGSK